MKKPYPIIMLVFLCVSISTTVLNGQQNYWISGKISDAQTKEVLIAATISAKEKNIGTISDHKGKFELKIPKEVKTLVISYIGYTSYEIDLSTLKKSFINIRLSKAQNEFDQITIFAKPPVVDITENDETIKDFLVDDYKLIVLSKDIGNGYNLKLLDYEGYIFHKLPLKDIRHIEFLKTSCLGTHFLVTEHHALQLQLHNDSIFIAHKEKRSHYDQFIKNCLDVNEDYIYVSNFSDSRQSADIHGFNRNRPEKIVFGEITDKINVANYQEDKPYLDFMEDGNTTDFSTINDYDKLQDFYNFWEKAALLAYNFYLPLDFYFHADEDNVFVLDHENHLLSQFNITGKMVKQEPLEYSRDRSWSGKILKDPKNEKLYTFLKFDRKNYLVNIDLPSGNLIPVMEFKADFLEKMEVYDDKLFFTNSGITEDKTERILRYVKVY